MTDKRKYFHGTLAALTVIGHDIREARKRRKYSESELAQRVGCSRETIRNIEAGKPTVEIGLIFEAAARVGLVLFGNQDHNDERGRRIENLMRIQKQTY